MRDILEISSYNRGFSEAGLLNDARQILLRSTPVATATKFGTKSATTRPIYEIIEKNFSLSHC